MAQTGNVSQRFTLRGPDGSEASISELRDGFRQGFVFELLDLTSPNTPLEVHVLALNPTSYTLGEPFQVDVTPGQGNEVVTEETGIIVREIRLEGTMGLSPKTARGFVGAQGGGQALTGTEHFQSLRNLFRRYSALKKDPAKSASIRLLFHALRDDDHFVVIPRQFETPRDATSRVHYKYRITMTAVAEATVSGLRRDQPLGEDGFTNALRDINEAFNDGRAAFAEVTANIAEIKRKVGNIQAVMVQAASVLNAVGNFVRGAASAINYPLQLVATCTDMLARAGDDLIEATASSGFGILTENARSLRQLESSIDRIAMYDDRFAQLGAEQIATLFRGERRVTNADIDASGGSSSPGAGGATVGSRVRASLGSAARLAGLDVPSEGGFDIHEVRRTDSLESIASRYGTTPEVVALINNLLPPYIVPGGGPGFAGEGDRLLVPSAVSGRSSGRGAVDYLTPEEALYGVDFALAPHAGGELFDLRVETVRGGYDAELIGGIANVVQGTEITVNTELGTTQYIPDLGIRRNVGVKGTTQHMLLGAIVLREAVLSDARISGIESARVVLDGDVLSQEITPIVRGQRPGATLVLPFGRVSSGE